MSKRSGKCGECVYSPKLENYEALVAVVADLKDCIGDDDFDRRLAGVFRTKMPPLGVYAFLRRNSKGEIFEFVSNTKRNEDTMCSVIDAFSKFMTYPPSQRQAQHEPVSSKICDNIKFVHPYTNEEGVSCGVVSCSLFSVQKFSTKEKGGKCIVDCAVLVDSSQALDGEKTDTTFWSSITYVFDEAIRQRCDVYADFPGVLSSYYLREAHKRLGQDRWLPPWSKNREVVDTITVSLDLRRSTLAMEKAANPGMFAMWLNVMVAVLRALVHRHMGVFDKFTGDGIIAHFLPEDLKKVDHKEKAMLAAVACADEMVVAVDYLLKSLRPFLRYNCRAFGAGIGIAMDRAYWRMDSRHHLIVVGAGVVDACRMSSATDAGDIFLTLNAYHEYCITNGRPGLRGCKVPFKAKNYPEDLNLEVWRIRSDFTEESQVNRAAIELCNKYIAEIFGDTFKLNDCASKM
ncbi:MAG: hypothetical protein H7840_01085 [Alphaproteobacteria bacterium]